MGGAPATIHSASARPAPAEETMPIELNPAATKKFGTPGASPSTCRVSGVKPSGPFMKCWMPVRSRIGRRARPAARKGSKWSQSSGSMRNGASPLAPAASQGLASGSKPPSTSLPASSFR